MGWIYEDPDEWETLPEGESYADHPGSTLTFGLNGVGRRKRSPDEVAMVKAKRLSDREDALLAEADIIRAHRLEQQPRQEPDRQPALDAQVKALMAELAELRAEAARRDAPAWAANAKLNRKVETLLAPLEAIARMQLVTNNWTNATTLSTAIRMAENAVAAAGS